MTLRRATLRRAVHPLRRHTPVLIVEAKAPPPEEEFVAMSALTTPPSRGLVDDIRVLAALNHELRPVSWRGSESNRCTRICSPLPPHENRRFTEFATRICHSPDGLDDAPACLRRSKSCRARLSVSTSQRRHPDSSGSCAASNQYQLVRTSPNRTQDSPSNRESCIERTGAYSSGEVLILTPGK